MCSVWLYQLFIYANNAFIHFDLFSCVYSWPPLSYSSSRRSFVRFFLLFLAFLLLLLLFCVLFLNVVVFEKERERFDEILAVVNSANWYVNRSRAINWIERVAGCTFFCKNEQQKIPLNSIHFSNLGEQHLIGSIFSNQICRISIFFFDNLNAIFRKTN